jgi:PII-like signaling protein
MVKVVDSEEKIQSILPSLEDMLGGGLITYEKVHVIRYSTHKE